MEIPAVAVFAQFIKDLIRSIAVYVIGVNDI